MNKKVHILGGGTLAYVRSHLALCAPAYGTTARKLERLCRAQGDKLDVVLHLTRMAGGNKGLETVEDVARLLDEIVADLATKIVFLNVALCDFRGIVGDEQDRHKHGPRLSTRSESIPKQMELRPLPKMIGTVRRHRKDIFLVGFKHTSGASPNEQYVAGLHLVKEASCNLVLANDTVSRLNMVVTPEEARYHVTTDRDEALRGLVEMAYLRSHLTFTRSTVVAGEPVPWDSPLVPDSLREASLALGVANWRTSLRVIIRTALGGIVTACLLAVARAAGETAPLLFTALNNQYWNLNPGAPTASLTVAIFNYAISPYDDWHAKAWTASLVLLIVVGLLNIASRWLTRNRLKGAR